MANPTHSNSPIQNFAPDASVQTGTQEGEWMYLQKASEVTGLHEKTLRRYIKKKLLKSKRLGKQINSPLQVWITPEIMETVAAETSVVEEMPESYEEDEEIEASSIQNRQAAISTDVEQVIKVIAQQFADKLDEQKQLIFEMRNELVEKDRQILLLPDLQKRAEEERKSAEMRELEVNALQKQIAALQEQMTEELNEIQKQATEKALLESEIESLKKELESKVAETEKKPWWKSWFGIE